MVPDLDELLQNIRGEAKRENALTLYEGTRQDDLVNEEVDERILRLLGLEEVFDIDYGTYLTLLKEKMIAARMAKQELSTEESELLTGEFKRIKGKVGRFKIKKKRITIGDQVSPIIKANKLLKSEKIKIDSEESQGFEGERQSKIEKYLTDIISIVKSIKELLIDRNNLAKNIRDSESKRLERGRRESRENQLEKKEKGNKFLKNLKKSLPRLGIFDRLKKFIVNILLGKAVLGLLDWLADSKNKGKIDAIGKFLSDWWPALLGAYFFFVNPLGKFIRTIILTLAKYTTMLLTKAIPKLIAFAAKNPLISLGVLGGVATLGGFAWSQKEENALIEKEADKRNVDKSVVEKELKEARKNPMAMFGEVMGQFSGGGGVPGKGNKDTIPAMLTPGEFVMSKGAVNKFGVANLMAMNELGGGDNKPKFIKGITYASGGGEIGKNSTLPKGPKISNADYASLLAISALEDDKAQGRADVAQSLYNRLYSASNYGTRYNQKSNTLKGLITAGSYGGSDGGGQYQPTFGNPEDWDRIVDKKTAAIAIMNSTKGRKYGWTMQQAMQQIEDTEKSLNNPVLQQKARSHVGGRTYFLGTSEQGNMQKGDVLRDPTHNFFSMWYEEKSKYGRERLNTAASTPQRLLPSTAPMAPPGGFVADKVKRSGPKGLIESLTDTEGMSGIYMKPINALFNKKVSTLIPDAPTKSSQMITLPPQYAGGPAGNPTLPNLGSKEPDFPTSSHMGMETRLKKLDTYGVIS